MFLFEAKTIFGKRTPLLCTLGISQYSPFYTSQFHIPPWWHRPTTFRLLKFRTWTCSAKVHWRPILSEGAFHDAPFVRLVNESVCPLICPSVYRTVCSAVCPSVCSAVCPSIQSLSLSVRPSIQSLSHRCEVPCVHRNAFRSRECTEFEAECEVSIHCAIGRYPLNSTCMSFDPRSVWSVVSPIHTDRFACFFLHLIALNLMFGVQPVADRFQEETSALGPKI